MNSPRVRSVAETDLQVVELPMARNSEAEKILAEKLRKIGWKNLEGAGISAGDIDTVKGPKRPLRKGPEKKRR
jgi:hypothetical protein